MSSITKSLMFVVLIFCTVIFSTAVFAARPLATDDAYTVKEGEFQVEAGFDFTRQDNHDKEFGPSVTLSYCLLERMDVGVGSAYLFVDPSEGKDENGFGDTGVKVKYHLMEAKGLDTAFRRVWQA